MEQTTMTVCPHRATPYEEPCAICRRIAFEKRHGVGTMVHGQVHNSPINVDAMNMSELSEAESNNKLHAAVRAYAGLLIQAANLRHTMGITAAERCERKAQEIYAGLPRSVKWS